ncbi:CHAT domain-containing protein [Collybia nuda]|uniref:CHAT domain-containing protein n=1 Tax=Collybia nuda TaxID=64659 RepID=A0A9P5Y5F4_9AGAR|nr:CHAT domain-containing protein [Collybia nuda]
MIRRCSEYLASLSPGCPELARSLDGLSELYCLKYRYTGDTRDMETAFRFSFAAVEATVAGHPDLLKHRNGLARDYSDRYKRYGDLDDLESTIKHAQAVVDGLPSGHPQLPGCQENLASAYKDKYARTGDMLSLISGLECAQVAVDITSSEDPELPDRHHILAIMYGKKYQRTGEVQDLEASLGHAMAAVELTLEGDPELPGRHQIVAASYIGRYRRTGDIEHLNSGLKYAQAAVDTTPMGHPERPRYLHILAAAHDDKYRRTGDITSLEEGVKLLQAAVAGTSPSHPQLHLYKRNLAMVQISKYRRTGETTSLDAALKYGQEAVDELPEGHPDLPECLQNLGISYRDAHIKSGDIDQLDKSLKYAQASVDLTPLDHPEQADRLRDLAATWNNKYKRTGDIRDLEASLECDQRAADATPKGHPEYPGCQYNLAVSYSCKYDWTGDIQNLKAAVLHSHAALNELPEGHPALPQHLNGLSRLYNLKYYRTRDIQSIDAAVIYAQSAVDKTPQDHTALPKRHQDLAIVLNNKYKETENSEDLEAALKYSQLATSAIPQGHTDHAEAQHILAGCFYTMSQKLADAQTLENSIKYAQSAINAAPTGHPSLSKYLHLLALCHIEKFEKNQDVHDRDMAYEIFESALKSTTSSPEVQWNIAVHFTKMAAKFGSRDALQICSTALNILPTLLWLGNSIDVRHNTLTRLSVPQYISEAVIKAIKANRLETAIEFFEQGLSTTHKQGLQLKLDHKKLKATLPLEAQRLHHLSAMFQGASQKSVDPDININYDLLAQERQDLIAGIRTHAGFSDFLLPPKYTVLCQAAQDGPVIMLNHSKDRIDAVIIFSPSIPPLHLPLPNVSSLDAGKQLTNLNEALQKLSIHTRNMRLGRPFKVNQIPPEVLFTSIISWLWEFIVKPIFQVLAEHGIQDGRLWWCPSGPFTYLPLHAAAPIDSKFVQSYTPTLDALIHANSKENLADNYLTAVGVVETHSYLGQWAKLPSVETELDTVTGLLGNQAQQLKDSNATIANVVKEMQSSSWLHLACHGQQAPDDPLRSGLMLYDGKLELGQILDLDLPKARFVYLSACETAMGDGNLSNEAMHMVGGFIAAGFQGAIGTLWSMADKDGPKVAEIVYKTILGEENNLDVKMAAVGLHLAVQKLREDGVPLHQWMPFIHMGI